MKRMTVCMAFAAYRISQDHNSIDPMPGMDAEVDRYRKMVESK